MESAPFGVSRLKCGSGKRRERRRFWIPVGAAHRAARGIQVSHTFFQPRKGDPRGRPYGDIRTRSVGSANSGAVRKPHQEQILPHSGPSGPAGNQAFTQILRAGNGTIPFRRGPRKWGPGCATWSTGTVLLGANPGDPLGTFPSLGKYLAPQGETLQNRAAKSPCD